MGLFLHDKVAKSGGIVTFLKTTPLIYNLYIYKRQMCDILLVKTAVHFSTEAEHEKGAQYYGESSVDVSQIEYILNAIERDGYYDGTNGVYNE